ncbi:MAG: hypothetical protein VST67_02150, partial [Nitrospirota bacterium]|nr:hypothetical protein [Nitrospirota bacterium]
PQTIETSDSHQPILATIAYFGQDPSIGSIRSLNLKAAVGREKTVQAIDVHRECKNCVVTFWVMSQFLHFLGASRGCADFRDPTAVFRLNAFYTISLGIPAE